MEKTKVTSVSFGDDLFYIASKIFDKMVEEGKTIKFMQLDFTNYRITIVYIEG
jgi:hypothetical protein